MDRSRDLLEEESISGYYVQKRTKKIFAVIQECKIMHGKNWVKGVCYVRKGEMFIRSKNDFAINFEKQ